MAQSSVKCVDCARLYLVPVGYVDRAIQCPFCGAWMDPATGEPAAPLPPPASAYVPPRYLTGPDRFRWYVRAGLVGLIGLIVAAIVIPLATSDKPSRAPTPTLAPDVTQWISYHSPDRRFQAKFPGPAKTGVRLYSDDTVVQYVAAKTDHIECEVAWFDLPPGTRADLLHVQMLVRQSVGKPTTKDGDNFFHNLPGRYLEFGQDHRRVQIAHSTDRVWVLSFKGRGVSHGQFFANVKLSERDFGKSPLRVELNGTGSPVEGEDLGARYHMVAWGGSGPYVWRAERLPEGIELRPVIGEWDPELQPMMRCDLTGRIAATGKHEIAVSVTDADGREFRLAAEFDVIEAPDSIGELVAELTVLLTRDARPQQTTSISMPVGVSVLGNLAARDPTGRYEPYVASCTYHDLPDWLNAAPESSDGYFSGEAPAAGIYRFSATAVMKARSVHLEYPGRIEITIEVKPAD